ncbi:MAG: hypothetical protein HZB22_08020 [Deltaproteobacteria bacterium]|nr:hypothetical protein [Deltaproteobacteria bacterium]
MSNFDTIKAITENMEEVLRKEGMRFSLKTYEDERGAPASHLPLGKIYYAGESFQNVYGERPLYAEVEFVIKIVIGERDPADLIREQQMWAHKVRGALCAEALNINGLAASKYVSRVRIQRIDAENRKDTSTIVCRAAVRYRES